MSILIINAGSSSIKYTLFEIETLCLIDHALIEEIESHEKGFYRLRELLALHQIDIASIDAIGHRIVHGGEYFSAPIKIDESVLNRINELSSLAPLHNPHQIEGIRAAQSIAPKVPNIAVFDTAFHHTIPEYAYRYPLPYPLQHTYGIRKYGFHGTSHHYMALKASEILNRPLKTLNLITFHIGNGVSVCAIHRGISIDTTMGMTPLEGMMMGTRSGSIDPSIIGFLLTHTVMNIDEIEYMLNHECGLKAVGGTNDMRKIITHAKDGDDSAILAIEMFTYRLKAQLGAYMAILGNIDGIVFTGGIGEHSALIRERICEGLGHFGIRIDHKKNSANDVLFGESESTIALINVLANEEYHIATQVRELLGSIT